MLLINTNTHSQVFAALKEWESGFRNAIQFTTNLYHGVYLDHIKGLNEIKEEKPLAYTSLMRRLFHMVSYVMVYSGLSVACWLT